jgi:two-component system, NtrC family, nitrogen regulation sensor histidine kinase NtrY
MSVTREATNLIISITDNGTGIPDEMVKKIFQPYFTTKSSGTGLGLAMTKKIIEFWKGTIWFETVPGQGTTFFIQLPLAKAD